MTEVTSNVEVADMSEFFEHTLQTLIQAGRTAKAQAIASNKYIGAGDYESIGLQVPCNLSAKEWFINRFFDTPNAFFLIQERIARAELIEANIDRLDSIKAKAIYCANDFQSLDVPDVGTDLDGILTQMIQSSEEVRNHLDAEFAKELSYTPPEAIYILRPGEFFSSVRHAKFRRWINALSVRSKALYGIPYEPLVICLTEGK